MKADELLAETRAQIVEWEETAPNSRAEHEAAEAFTRAFAELDAELKDGKGLPPGEWLAWRHTGYVIISAADLELILPRVEHQQTLNGLERNAVRRVRQAVDDVTAKERT